MCLCRVYFIKRVDKIIVYFYATSSVVRVVDGA